MLLQPVSHKNHAPGSGSVKIDYATNAITPFLNQDSKDETAGEGFEAHGIVGIYIVLVDHVHY